MFLNRIDRYIFKTVLNSFLIVTTIFCILFFIFTYLAQVSNSHNNASNWELTVNTLYQLPGILYTLLPACAMVGALMGLSLLANNSEIIVLRSSGRSTFQIAKGVIIVGLIGAAVAIVFGGYIAPVLQKLADTNTVQYNSNNIWLKTTDGITHIRHIDPEKKSATGISRFIIENNKLKEVRFATTAKYSTDTAANAYNINKIVYPITDIQKQLEIVKNISQDKWADPLPLSVARIITINDNDYLSLTQLTKFMFSNTQANDKTLSLKFWQEIFQPISLMILILLSVPLSIGSNRSSTLVVKLILGALFGFSFFIINQIFGPIALILHMPPIFGAAGPTLIALALLIYLFIKSKET
ncbi:LPS export ABC transporter permease LptG [Allofrancisella guangzhouensis]|uniref:Permease n=1 Tax=Allofrancisella guangzhouensis TaxID=594679 RepID=A0A0A8E4T5_9GAMM|nr:LPS export ABC transporter permease LptG [Allofrancisella guangzhouensis]AJC49250.1 permease [Allofrancisella guangzhouensis]MBK2044894.1 LPS export ABC transporter permease LptG [Allofrancisella guangzhouensis]MBK2046419.1 LPS export ABC transporter permease LptG [Allofrancisella guangzhouensis]